MESLSLRILRCVCGVEVPRNCHLQIKKRKGLTPKPASVSDLAITPLELEKAMDVVLIFSWILNSGWRGGEGALSLQEPNHLPNGLFHTDHHRSCDDGMADAGLAYFGYGNDIVHILVGDSVS